MDGLNLVKGALLGLLEGIMGLTPLSARGHALILERLSGQTLSGSDMLPFLTALRLGLIIAALAGAFGPLVRALRHPLKGELKWALISALPLAAVILIADSTGWLDTIEDSAFTLLPYALIFTAAVLFLAGRIAKNRRIAGTSRDRAGFKQATGVGLMQCLSVFTGASTVGMELTGALSSGLSSGGTAGFAYLCFVPALIVRSLPDAAEAISSGAMKAALSENGYVLLAGFVAAAVTGFIAVKLTQWLIRRERTGWFSLYLVLLAAVVVAGTLSGKI